MDEVYVAFECTAKLYFRGPQRPVEHRCRLILGSGRHQNLGPSSCSLTIEGNACLRRTFRVTKENVSNVAARLGDGTMTVVFRNSACDSLVVKEVVNRSALTLFHKIVSAIWMGVGEPLSRGTTINFSSPPGGLAMAEVKTEAGRSVSKTEKSKLQLSLGKRYGDTRGGRMVEAAQNKPVTTCTSSFYKTDSCVMSSEPFLPKTPPTASPYFQRAPRRSLTFELSSDSEGGRAGGTNNLTPRDQSLGAREHLGARKAAVITRRRLPLGDIAEHTQSSVRDCLIPDEPPNRDGFANLGNTCYMNAVLQVLLGLEPFSDDLLNHQLINRVNPQSLCRMLYLLLKSKRAKDSYDSQKILLRRIKSVIEISRPKFSGYKQQDAHELLTQCLDQVKDDSKHVMTSTSGEEKSEFSVCPVVRNFECEMCRSITCKRDCFEYQHSSIVCQNLLSCGKVTEVRELIYDFALQLPKSVKLRANEQANLQDLMDAFFVSEEVEYKCSVCSSNTATMSCRLARLPRVLILFLKRYGYNPNLSRNSKRIDFIRIPRFISVGHLCSETTQPPSEYHGPCPRDRTSSIAGSDNKENFPSSTEANNPASKRDFPQPENICVVDGDRGILGKRRSGENLEDDIENNCDVLKKQKIDCVSISDSVTAHATETIVSTPIRPSASGNRVNTQVAPSGVSSGTEFNGFVSTTGHSVTTSNTSTAASTTLGGAGEDRRGDTDCDYSQSSVGRSIAAEFDSLFSPEVIFEFDNNTSFTTSADTMKPTAVMMSSTTSDKGSTIASDGVPLVAQAEVPLPVRTSGSVTESVVTQTEHPHARSTLTSDEENLMLGLFGGVDCNKSSHSEHATTTAVTENISSGATEMTEKHGQTTGTDNDEELKRAMEESIRDQQSSDVMLLGMSEDEQLKLALELSMQEQCPVEASSSARVETPTPDTHQPETYKLVGIVNHIGKGSSGGHYVSDVCSVSEGMWRSYNDYHVSEIREEDVRQKRQGTGYIFFYMHKSILGSIGHSNEKRTT